MKSPKWVATTRQLIKSKYGFGWSISGWERNNKLITKVVYRYQNGSRNSILVDLDWSSDNSDKMINLVVELADEFGENAEVKALANLNQLHKKGLIKTETFSTMKVGNYSAFYPRSWDGCATMTPEKYDWLIAKIEEYNYKVACTKQDQEHKQRKLELKEKGS